VHLQDYSDRIIAGPASGAARSGECELALQLTGTGDYRSFLNNPSTANSPDDAAALIFGEGDLDIIGATPGGTFAASLCFGGGAVMDLTGTVGAEGHRPNPYLRQPCGPCRPADPDYCYDYLFYVVPGWPQGVDQRDALVGRVVRAADRGTARKGATASTITVRRGA